MVLYYTNEFRSGLKIIQNGEPSIIIDIKFVKPGKGNAFNRVSLRNLISGKIFYKTFKSGSYVEGADVIDVNLTYLYKYCNLWYFINKKNFEQIVVDNKAIANKSKWLVEQIECIITLWNNNPIYVNLPKFVNLEIINTDKGIKGDTLSRGYKLAILNTGAVVKVPIFIKKGEFIKIDTRSGEYVSRV